MRRVAVLLLAVVVCIALPVFAQETKDAAKDAAAMMPPMPKPLDDEFLKWNIGEWEGTTTMPMGTSQDWQKVEMSLDDQFILIQYNSSVNGQVVYKGAGPMTIDPKTGGVVGYWFDNMRGMYKGVGKREGNKVSMTWEGGDGTTRWDTTEKVGEDKMVVTFKSKMPDGSMQEGRSEFTRKKMATTK
jgi:hypothetical protein